MEIRVNNLKKHFGSTRAVDGISFDFASGHIFGFVGPNGAGKTTTMRILATMDEPTEGDAWIDGVSVVHDPEKVRHMVGFMPDTLPTHRDITVHEYLDFFARAYGLVGRKRTRTLEGLEEFTNLTGIRDKVLRALSKGMKQRVSLARAIVHDPNVLVLDEPAAGLDPRARIELRELLKILAERGTAILVSSHILTELSEICTGTVIIEQGRIIRAGTLASIISQEMPNRAVSIRVIGDPTALHRALLEMPQVEGAQINGPAVDVLVIGDEHACHAILAGLIAQEQEVIEFSQAKADLEELFMNLTKGEVQ
jgi:ABC-2 type transport system ATP-binding protein